METGEPDRDQIANRANNLLPEEKAVGSDDPHAQAEAILADSDERASGREEAPDSLIEHRTSDEATEPVDRNEE